MQRGNFGGFGVFVGFGRFDAAVDFFVDGVVAASTSFTNEGMRSAATSPKTRNLLDGREVGMSTSVKKHPAGSHP